MKQIVLNENSKIVISGDTKLTIQKNSFVDLWIEYTVDKVQLEIELEDNAHLNVVHHYNQKRLNEVCQYKLNTSSEAKIVFTSLLDVENEHDIKIHLIGEHARVEVVSGLLIKKHNVIDIAIIHEAKNTYGNMEHYAVVSNNAYLKLYGVGKICEKMSGSAAHQTTRILTMAKDHQCEVTPVLIIDENDVAASHANSIGQPDDLQLYYLQSRGLSIEVSLNLISSGYLEPMLILLEETTLHTPLSQTIESIIG